MNYTEMESKVCLPSVLSRPTADFPPRLLAGYIAFSFDVNTIMDFECLPLTLG